MTTYSTVKARNLFSDVLNKAAFGKERIILTRRGRNLCAVVPIEDMELLEKFEETMDIEDARAASREAAECGTVSLEDLKRELGLS